MCVYVCDISVATAFVPMPCSPLERLAMGTLNTLTRTHVRM